MNNINKIGYACVNTELKKQGIKVNRKMIKKTFEEKGILYAGELAYKNLNDMLSILEWNINNNIRFYRMSSSMFPWMSEYEISDLPNFKDIKIILEKIGKYALENDIRLTYHPGAFTILASPSQSVVDKAIKELNQHGEIMDLMGLSRSHHNKINIHIGGAYGDKKTTLKRFYNNFMKLNDSASKRLTIENDDRKSLYTVEDLLALSNWTGMPIVFDYHHYNCHKGNLTKLEALDMALNTWPNDIVPVVHFSSSKKTWEDNTVRESAHSDYIYDDIDTNFYAVDVMLECKMKEQAVLGFIQNLDKEDYLPESENPLINNEILQISNSLIPERVKIWDESKDIFKNERGNLYCSVHKMGSGNRQYMVNRALNRIKNIINNKQNRDEKQK